MTSRKIDMNIPNVPYPTAARGLVLGANGKLNGSTLPDDVVLDGDLAGITASLGNKVDKDSVVAAATRIVASKLAGGDAQPAFRILGDGTHTWGQGGATALDTNLYRSVAGTLQTDSRFYVNNSDFRIAGASAGITFNSDTNLYRLALNTLKTDGIFHAVGDVFAKSGTAGQVGLTTYTGLPAVNFGGADSIYRPSAGTLKTDGTLAVGTAFSVSSGASSFIVDSAGKVWWGSFDTNLYRSAATVLKTDGAFLAGGQVQSYAGTAADRVSLTTFASGVPGVLFGSDTNLYRSAANTLQTDGQFNANGGVRTVRPAGNWALFNYKLAADANPALIVGGDGLLQWGAGGASAIDTNLYRSAAGVLKTDGVLQAGPRVQVRGDGTGGDILFGGSAATFDAAIYRSASRELAVDGVGGATAWLKVSADITARYSGSGGVGVMIGDIGSARSGMLLGASGDTNLYRSAVGTLRTDTDIDVGRDLSIRRNLYANITAGGVTGSITNKIQVWNANTGAYVGVIPIYNA